MFKAQEVVKDKFWIVTNKLGKVGTLRALDEGYEFFNQLDDSKTHIESLDKFAKLQEREVQATADGYGDVRGYPSKEANPVLESHPDLPVYRKSATANVLFAAGYYVVKFDGMGWQWAFSPKLATLEKYEYKGPFYNEWEMNQQLRKLK